MADEAVYGYGMDSGNKRKYEDQTPPSGGTRRVTGFSAPIAGQSPGSVNDAIEMAKQKAQEIAARLNDETKRPRVDNGGSGFDSNGDAGQNPLISSVSSVTPSFLPHSYGYQGSKKIDIPNGRVGVIIGKAGETIKQLQLQSGAKIQVTRDTEADPNSLTRSVELMGTPDQVARAEELIHETLNEAETGGSGGVSRRLPGQQYGAEQFVMKIPSNKVGLVIGKGGETIKNMQASSGARIQVIPLHPPPGDTSTERTVQIDGSSEQIEAAKQLVNEVISENRLRNPAISGGYYQQGYQARPPANWASPVPPMQQPGYGYTQAGAYPGPAAQYNNMSQPPYPGYPPQSASAAYATGWDQTTGTPNQQTSQAGGYDYYNQQQQVPGGPSSAPADNNTSYGYSQPPAAGYNSQGQGYAQDGYGGYQAPASQPGYGQTQPNPLQGYDQQQSYSTPAYGNATNPTPEGHTPYGGGQGDASQAPSSVQSSAMGQQGYNMTQQPSPSPSPNPNPNPASYPPQGSTQSGYAVPTTQPSYGSLPPSGYGPNYGAPQAQKPPANQPSYGQPQLSPNAQGGYVQPAPLQSGYPQAPPAQGGYGNATAQPGYGAPPYGAPPVTQSGYGQQLPPPYNSSYSAGYSQPPAYPADGAAGGNAHGSYDAAPTSQAVQPSGVAKASPPS